MLAALFQASQICAEKNATEMDVFIKARLHLAEALPDGWVHQNRNLIHTELNNHTFIFIVGCPLSGQQNITDSNGNHYYLLLHAGTSVVTELFDTITSASSMFHNNIFENEGIPSQQRILV